MNTHIALNQLSLHNLFAEPIDECDDTYYDDYEPSDWTHEPSKAEVEQHKLDQAAEEAKMFADHAADCF